MLPSEGDHPALLQPLEVWVVILPPPRILTTVQEVDSQFGKVLELASVESCPVFTEATVFPDSSAHVTLVS